MIGKKLCGLSLQEIKMKITKKKLKQIINEEVKSVLEASYPISNVLFNKYSSIERQFDSNRALETLNQDLKLAGMSDYIQDWAPSIRKLQRSKKEKGLYRNLWRDFLETVVYYDSGNRLNKLVNVARNNPDHKIYWSDTDDANSRPSNRARDPKND